MITIQSAMLVLLGFCLAALLTCFLAPFYRKRAARLATEELRRSVPLTPAEIAADKDRLRAEFAIRIHKLESRLEDAGLSAARQSVEINRRDATISELEGAVAKLQLDLDGHENARRVLEQTITERLPKVEHRLGEAKKLLFQRDREIAALTQTAQKQASALDEATQINTQQRDELHRANAALTTRAARNRDVRGDQRFDGEIALRAELEALRAKTRDQAQLISRLQGGQLNGGVIANDEARAATDAEAELSKLRASLAEAERALQSASAGSDVDVSAQSKYESELRSLRAANQDQQSEIARLKAALQAYESISGDDRAIGDSKISLKAKLSAIEAQAAEQATTIQTLRAEVAGANEKLARQAAHYRDEMQRLGAGTRPASGSSPRDAAATAEAARRPLSDRISAPRVASPLPEVLKPVAESSRSSGFMNMQALSDYAAAGQIPGTVEIVTAVKPDDGRQAGNDAAAKPARRPGLLQRIAGLEKPVV